jgi:hypothetical protein
MPEVTRTPRFEDAFGATEYPAIGATRVMACFFFCNHFAKRWN